MVSIKLFIQRVFEHSRHDSWLSVGTGKISRARGHMFSFTWIGSSFWPSHAAENTPVQYNCRRLTWSYRVKMIVQITWYGQSLSRAGLEGYHPRARSFFDVCPKTRTQTAKACPHMHFKNMTRRAESSAWERFRLCLIPVSINWTLPSSIAFGPSRPCAEISMRKTSAVTPAWCSRANDRPNRLKTDSSHQWQGGISSKALFASVGCGRRSWSLEIRSLLNDILSIRIGLVQDKNHKKDRGLIDRIANEKIQRTSRGLAFAYEDDPFPTDYRNRSNLGQ